MKLGQFLSKAPKPSAPAQRVEMTLCGMNADAHQVRAPAYATFQVVTEAKEQESLVAALTHVQGKSQALGMVPSSLLSREEDIQFLATALRDYEDPRQSFASADELRLALSSEERQRLRAEYTKWEATWYPKKPSLADQRELEAEAGKS